LLEAESAYFNQDYCSTALLVVVPVYFSALMRKTIAKAAVFGSLLFQDTDNPRTIVS